MSNSQFEEFISELSEAYSNQSLTQEIEKLKEENAALKIKCTVLSNLNKELLKMEPAYLKSEESNKKLKSLIKHIIGTYL